MISRDEAARLLDGVDVLDEGSGPVLALAHGAGGGVRQNFEPILAAGARRFTGPYYPGAGGTPEADGPLSIVELADQVVAAGVRAGGDRFPVLGLSLGAAVATTAAARHPEHVSALVLTVGVLHPDAQSLAVVRAWRALAGAGELDALAELLLHVSGTGDDLAGLDERAHAAAAAQTRRTYPPGGAAHAELVSRVDVRSLLAGIDVPTLVVVGGRDRIVLPGTARGFGAIRGSQVLEYPDAGHIFGPAHAPRWAADVHAFFGAISA